MNGPARPAPAPDSDSREFWDGARRHRLVLARCSKCGKYNHPPGPVCAGCASTDPEYRWEDVVTGATLRSWTFVRTSFLPGFDDDLPYALVDAELDAQPDLRMIGRLVDGPDARLNLDARLEVVFDDYPTFSVPAFRLAARP